MQRLKNNMASLGVLSLGILIALTIAACGDTTTTDTEMVTDQSVVTEEVPVTPAEPVEPQPGDEVMTEEKLPGGGEAKEKETVAPKKDQGDCAPGEVEAGGGCIPNQPSG